MNRLMMLYFKKLAFSVCGAMAILLSVSLNEKAALSATIDTNEDGITVEVVSQGYGGAPGGPGEIRITKNGTTITVPTPDGYNPAEQYNIPYAYDYAIAAGPNNFCLVYSGERIIDGGMLGASVYQLYDYSGNKIGSETRFTDQTNQGHRPSVTALSNGSYMLVYQTNNPIGHPQSPIDRVGYIVGRTLAGNGSQMGSLFIVAFPVYLLGPPVAVTENANGQVTMAWETVNGEVGSWSSVYDTNSGNLVEGATGDGYIYGNGGSDQIVSEDGDDHVDGGVGTDIVETGGGDDSLNGGPSGDTLDGGDGIDAASYETADVGVTAVLESDPVVSVNGLRTSRVINTGDAAGDIYKNIENLIGSPHVDTLIGNKYRNTLTGGKSGDILDGRAGIDIAGYSNSETSVVVNLSNPSENQGDAQGDTYTSIEGLEGSMYADTLIGNDLANQISGGLGGDLIAGRAGKDVLTGDLGSDSIDCGSDTEADIVKYLSIADTPVGIGRDQIINFKITNDKIDLSKIDANTKIKGNQAFLFSNTTPKANSVWYVVKGRDVFVRGDVNGNTKADFELLIKNTATIMQTTFVL